MRYPTGYNRTKTTIMEYFIHSLSLPPFCVLQEMHPDLMCPGHGNEQQVHILHLCVTQHTHGIQVHMCTCVVGILCSVPIYVWVLYKCVYIICMSGYA